jgi:hypothetical protein
MRYLNKIIAVLVWKTEINDCGNSLSWPRDILHQQKLALTSSTSGRRSVGVVRLRTKSHEVCLFCLVGCPGLDHFYMRYPCISPIVDKSEILVLHAVSYLWK